MHKAMESKKPEQAPLVSTKELYKDPNVARKIQQIQFGLQTPQEITKSAVFHVYERALYKMPERTPHANGPLDKRLGVSNKNYACETCGQKLADCPGHFGYIQLELPVFHIGYFKNTLQVLQCVCKSCSRLLLKDEERMLWVRRFRNPRVERMQREAMFRKVVDLCKRVRVCPHCGEYNGVVKKVTGGLKIVHEKYSKNHSLFEQYKASFDEAVIHNEQLKLHLPRITDDLHPLRVLALLERIPDQDCSVLDLAGRPEVLVMTHIAVPPVAIRPSVEMDGASNEDDITMKLMQIIEVNNVLRQGIEKGLPVNVLMENWDFLQVQCAMLINSDLPGLPSQFQTTGRPLRGFVQRLKGKQGRFRGNLSGKRVDFSGRTVISPDPNLQINQVCVPQHMAMVLTYPERVTHHNIEKLRQRIMAGAALHPGANFVAYDNGNKTFLKYGDRRKVAADLKVGDVVERHLEDGDVVLFNRQPSLHRISIMAFRAKVLPWRTLRFNECVCSPFNADFDGDEMNLHLPQTEEARAEALHLMGSVNNICTPKNGDIMISATQDFLTCAYLVTSKDAFYTRAEFGQLCATMGDGLTPVDLPTPALIKPLEMWTGKQLFSVLLRPNAASRAFVNVEMAERSYTKKGEHMCPADGYIIIRNSELVCGRLGKGILGGAKGGLFGTLNSDCSPQAAAVCMSRLAKMAARHMGNRGFSIGIGDVTPPPALVSAKAVLLGKGYGECEAYIEQYKQHELAPMPGCTLDGTLENMVTGVLNNIRETAGKLCMDSLTRHNAPVTMNACGSKGSTINIAQMVACVGQQVVSGKRCFNGFKDRTLPHFPRGDRTPAGKGFVANSFYTGLTPTEFFFHTMGGREGLVDTAVKTAETGYMSRRLMKALEDLYAHYDNTVRNAGGGIVQLVYGDDGMDPVMMEGKDGKPLDLERTLAKVHTLVRQRPHRHADREPVLLPAELEAAIKADLQASKLTEPNWCSVAFREGLTDFLSKQLSKYRKARERLGLSPTQLGSIALEHAAAQEGFTRRQLTAFLSRCVEKYDSKRIDPGSTVGAIGAQSIGEPGTQMTLKTFHFAGVASMNVTLGVPRIKEIINGAKNISTPIIACRLSVADDMKAARIVKGRLEKTVLGQVAESIKIVFRPAARGGQGAAEAAIMVRLDMVAIDALMLDIDAYTVKWSIVQAPKLKLKENMVRALTPSKLMVVAPDSSKQGLMYNLEQLLAQLPKVIVMGIPSVERALIHKNEKEGGVKIFVEGTNLQAVMGTEGVVGKSTSTNHVAEVERYLGIEAARSTIIKEITYTMSEHGMSIDARHTMLLADCMTYKGEVLGITRFGIAKMKDSVLHTASFEKTSDHLFDAAIHGRVDDITGVSESIIMGIPMPTGTGLFKLRHNVTGAGAGDSQDLPARAMPLLSY